MKKTWTIIVIILAVLIGWGAVTYNRLVKAQEAMTTSWGQVENVYQRRADLIPNLVAVVKSYADYEGATVVAVTEARAKAASTVVEEGNEAQFQEFETAQNDLTNSLNRLIITAENYPDLKANQEYLDLQAQLAGCEDRIQTERKRFNEQAMAYNQSIRRFPANIIAKIFGFEKRPYFEAVTDNAEHAPKIG